METLEPAVTLYDWVAAHAERTAPALQAGAITLVFGELITVAEQTAQWTPAAGGQAGDVVLNALPSGAEHLIVTLAVSRLGAVSVAAGIEAQVLHMSRLLALTNELSYHQLRTPGGFDVALREGRPARKGIVGLYAGPSEA